MHPVSQKRAAVGGHSMENLQMMSKRELPFKLFLLALPQATDRLQFFSIAGAMLFHKTSFDRKTSLSSIVNRQS